MATTEEEIAGILQVSVESLRAAGYARDNRVRVEPTVWPAICLLASQAGLTPSGLINVLARKHIYQNHIDGLDDE